MKKNLLYLGLTGYLLFALCTRLQAQTDSLQAHRYVTRATMYGVGFTNVFDTYLSPQEYKGIDFRISRETIRMTKLFDGNVSVQNFFQADVGYTHNRADNNNTFSGLVNWNYGLHYQFRLTENFKLLAGGRQRRICLQSPQFEQSGFSPGIRQSGRFGNGYLAFENQALSDGTPLSSQRADDRTYVLTALRTVLLRNLLTGQLQRSYPIYLSPQSTVSPSDAFCRSADRIYQDAFQLSGRLATIQC